VLQPAEIDQTNSPRRRESAGHDSNLSGSNGSGRSGRTGRKVRRRGKVIYNGGRKDRESVKCARSCEIDYRGTRGKVTEDVKKPAFAASVKKRSRPTALCPDSARAGSDRPRVQKLKEARPRQARAKVDRGRKEGVEVSPECS